MPTELKVVDLVAATTISFDDAKKAMNTIAAGLVASGKAQFVQIQMSQFEGRVTTDCHNQLTQTVNELRKETKSYQYPSRRLV